MYITMHFLKNRIKQFLVANQHYQLINWLKKIWHYIEFNLNKNNGTWSIKINCYDNDTLKADMKSIIIAQKLYIFKILEPNDLVKLTNNAKISFMNHTNNQKIWYSKQFLKFFNAKKSSCCSISRNI